MPRLDRGQGVDPPLITTQNTAPVETWWFDPKIYFAAAAVGKSSVTYHDIVDFVTKVTIDELIVAEVHGGSQLVVKTGSKAN